jgi:hypothetical protein
MSALAARPQKQEKGRTYTTIKMAGSIRHDERHIGWMVLGEQ